MAGSIDLNADVGEGLGPWPMGADDALIPLVTSVNVACGFHAGDPVTMRRTVRLALEAGCAVGAHPGYPDLAGFGRRAMAIAPDELGAAVLYQVAALAGVARAEGGGLTHVKPHGALYHRLTTDRGAAEAVATAVARFDERLRLVAPPGSVLLEAAAAAGLRTLVEGFADRIYEADGRLRSRDEPGALHATSEGAAAQALSIARDARATAVDGTPVDVPADTLCVHSDTPGAAAIAGAVRRVLAEAGVVVRAPDG
jgi:5-oxoprolinase (ATP-hydrolysing) subunit A